MMDKNEMSLKKNIATSVTEVFYRQNSGSL